MGDFVRDVGKRETDAWLEVDKLRNERDELREALQDCFDAASEMSVHYLPRFIEQRVQEALANLNKTDGE